jgi:hypothetical protein
MKDVSFLVMAMVLTALMLDHLDSIPTAPLICASVKVAGVFVVSNSHFNFAPLFLDSQFGMGNSAQGVHNNRPKVGLRRSKSTTFLHKIKKVDDNYAIGFLLRDVGESFPPTLENRSSPLQLGCDHSSRITVIHPTSPGSAHNVKET